MTTPEEGETLLAYLREHTLMSALSDEDLCREFLAVAPVFGRLGELDDILVERLCPGIISKMDEEAKETSPPRAWDGGGMRPLRLPADCRFCTACLRLMPSILWDAMICRKVECDPKRCRAPVELYENDAGIYEKLRRGDRWA